MSEINDLCVYKFSPSTDVRLNEVYYTLGEVKAGELLPISIDLTNIGSKTVNSFDVTISDATGIVDIVTVSKTVLPGDTATLNTKFTVPLNLAKKTDYTVTVLPLCETYKNVHNNSYTITVGYVDLALDLNQYYIENDSMIIANVSNGSDFPVTDATLIIREDEADGSVIKTVDIGELDAFETASVVIFINEDDINFNNSDSKALFFEVISSEEELVTGNNSGVIVVVQSDSSSVAVTGKVRSFNPKNETIIQLLLDDEVMYDMIIPAEIVDSGQQEQEFAFFGIAPGTYTLVITKKAHLKFTVHNVVVGDDDLDLTQDDREAVKLMTLICGDLNSDGQINSYDLLILLSNYLEQGENLPADLNGDGQVNSSDLLILLGNYLELDVIVH